MDKIKLIFGTQNSQPSGSYDYLFEKAYQEAYKPFLTVLYNFPAISLTLYYSGTLLQWLDDNHPEFLMLLNDMVKRKQVELLTGGFYDPIFPIIPSSDRIGQIEKLTTFLRKNFGKRPRGCWVTKLAWEPSLTSLFNTSGINYIFLDENHFRSAGIEGDSLYTPCITEDQGKTLYVFPLTTSLIAEIPHTSPEKIIERILSHANKNGPVVTLVVPGENFGLYNETKQLCYKEKWIETFLSLLQENHDAIEVINPTTYSKSLVPNAKGYFPCTSCEDMYIWLNPKSHDSKKKEKNSCNNNGVVFRRFLKRYSESNFLYSKMMFTSLLVGQIRGDKYKKKAGREELWKAQSNYPFWHGRHAGIYVNKLRKAAYTALIEAEKITQEKGVFIPSIIKTDFDFDGQDEYLYQGNDINAYVHTSGGVLFEMDFLPASWNYLDTMRRYKEPYHNKMTKNAGYDSYMRNTFIDHFFKAEDSINDFCSSSYTELGSFIGSTFEVENVNRDHNELSLKNDGFVRVDGSKIPVVIKKKYIFKKQSVDLFLTVKNDGNAEAPFLYGSELNISMLSNGIESERLFIIDSNNRKEIGNDIAEVKNAEELELEDRYNEVVVSVSAATGFSLWSFPIETNVYHFDQIEKIYQATCIVPRWSFTLKPKEKWEMRISIGFIQR